MGLLRISEEQSWLCSARIFNTLLDHLREALAVEQPALACAISAARDSQLHWWSIARLPVDEFQLVLRAVEKVRHIRSAEGPRNLSELDAYAMFMDRLDALARLLQADTRAGSVRSPS